MNTIETDVLVVGAGPAGLTTAALLAEYGVDAITVTKFPSTAHSPRGHITNQRTMEIFRELGIEGEIGEVAIPQDRMGVNVWATSFAGTELARMATWGTGADRQGDYEAASPSQICNISQHVLEPLILSASVDRAADIRFGHEVISLEQDEEKVHATVQIRETGERYQVEANYVIGCDGARSTVADSFGFEMDGESAIGHAFSVWIEADLSQYVAHRPGALFWVSPPGTDILFSPWTVVVPNTEWMALFLLRDFVEPDIREEAVLELVRASIGDPAIDVKIKNISPWQINHVVAREYRKGRALLAGDAAHRHPPANGLGTNTSVQDAYNLAWKLAMVLRGTAGPELLDTYSAERQPVGRQVVDRAIRSLGELTPLADALGLTTTHSAEERWDNYTELFSGTSIGADRRDKLLDAVELVNWQLNCHGVELGQRYASTSVVGDGSTAPEPTRDPELYYQPTTYPGAYLPHVWLAHETTYRSTLDLTGNGRFTLLTGVDPAEWTDAAGKVGAAYGVDIAVIPIGMRADYDDVLGEWTRIRGFDESGCLLVRPDRHIAWRSPTGVEDPQSILSSVLSAVLSRPEVDTQR